MRSHPATRYAANDAHHAAEVAALEARMVALEGGRLSSFVVGAVAALLRGDLPVPEVVPTAIAGLAFALFTYLVVLHRGTRGRLERARVAHGLARLGRHRLARDWRGIQGTLEALGHADPLLNPLAADDAGHPYVADLDLFGPASVRALLGPTPTPTGTETLRRWLRAPTTPAEIRRRQAAVRALAADAAARERLAIEALLLDPVDRRGWTAFLDWLSSPPLLGGALPAWSVVVARVAPAVTVGLFVAWAVGAELSAWAWVAPLLVQSLFAWRWGQALAPYFTAASAKSPGLRRHGALFQAWASHDFAEPEVAALQRRLTEDGHASAEIRRLERWLDAADSRASMLHFVLAAALFWDVHVAVGLERWRRRSGERVPDWFAVLGELEALSALATLAHDQPDWCVPELREGEAGLDAEGLGHPLLPDDERKTSDVSLGPPGRFLLVTGSNMSGKSTLLRSVGLAAVLAQAGSVVCARRLTLTPLRTFTSMRIHDSLTEGVSLFMAELLRLKALVDAADRPGVVPLLYLVDEVLQGTNSEERRVAARRIVRHLLGSGAIGAVTTHDLSLHDDPGLDPASDKVHFRETVDDRGGPALTFDYVLRPGLATSRNALKLLRLVGLDDPNER